MVPIGSSPAVDDRRFPRTRGDGPLRPRRPVRPCLVPPHPRGWSLRAGYPVVGRRGSPAPAGMVPRRSTRPFWRNRFPRTRGDGPRRRPLARDQGAVPPHPRGWSLSGLGRERRAAGSPAPAGMVPPISLRISALPRFPRTRGDGPSLRMLLVADLPVPPHPRGWSLHPLVGIVLPQGSPAPAGMVPRSGAIGGPPSRFPRTRGDGPPIHSRSRCAASVPPHPRGWSLYPRARRRLPPGSPAPAGMVPIRSVATPPVGRFPRTRGDGPRAGRPGAPRSSVPPHPRGWSLCIACRHEPQTGSPAPAGMVPRCTTRRSGTAWFPRTRGDGPRGLRVSGDKGRGSPAPAGMVRLRRHVRVDQCRFPRTRGDGPLQQGLLSDPSGVPPHPRGWSRSGRSGHSRQVGSPAPAGMVPRHGDRFRTADGFPRTRGDGPTVTSSIVRLRLVPPHPRGWSPRTLPSTTRLFGSPAPAGMIPIDRRQCAVRLGFPRTRGDGPFSGV